jgi:hypothetical protein
VIHEFLSQIITHYVAGQVPELGWMLWNEDQVFAFIVWQYEPPKFRKSMHNTMSHPRRIESSDMATSMHPT